MTYRFKSLITVSAYTEVEADSYEEALEEAKDREPGSIIASGYPEEDWIVDEIDGAPLDIHLEEDNI